jgi:Short C-terminal domain
MALPRETKTAMLLGLAGVDRSNKKVYGWTRRPIGLKPETIDAMLKARAIARVEANVHQRYGSSRRIDGVYLYFANAKGVDLEVVELRRTNPTTTESMARKWAVAFNKEVEKLRASDPAPLLRWSRPAPATDDPAAMLEKLAGLHDKGLITDAEFQAKRVDIRARI